MQQPILLQHIMGFLVTIAELSFLSSPIGVVLKTLNEAVAEAKMHRFLCHILCLSMCCLLIVLSGCSDNNDFPFPQSSQPAPPPETQPAPPTETPPTPLPEILVLTSPARIAAFDVDRLLVSDYESNYIYIVDKTTLRPTAKIKVQGKSTGIALADGKIFVGNRTLRSVDVFDLQGNYLYRLGTGKAQFLQINDVAVDATRTIVYALDTKGKCIKRFNLDGISAGTDIGVSTLQQPTALTVDPTTGNILISDFGNPGIPGVLKDDSQQVLPSVQIFNFDGTHIQTINGATIATSGGGMMGGTTTLQTTFSTPQGLYIDNNYLYLVDALSATIRVYNLSTLTQVKTFGVRGTALGELFYPLDIIVDNSTKDVFVTDNRNKRIAVYRGEGVAP
ncbi:MAG: 6-bladed beta-propeller [Desulfuromonadales bacterium]|nr:6-bladed beta-propeller [Desulfuromonadales bacterium]